jgi:hypothetical protein
VESLGVCINAKTLFHDRKLPDALDITLDHCTLYNVFVAFFLIIRMLKCELPRSVDSERQFTPGRNEDSVSVLGIFSIIL